MSAGEKYKESTKTHTATTRAQRREANTAPHEATNLLQSERRGRKRKKKRSYQTFTVFFYWQCIISCFKYPIKGTEIGSLALTACAPKSREEKRPKSLRLKLLEKKPKKKKKKKKRRDDSSHLWHLREGKYLRGHSQMRMTNTMVY